MQYYIDLIKVKEKEQKVVLEEKAREDTRKALLLTKQRLMNPQTYYRLTNISTSPNSKSNSNAPTIQIYSRSPCTCLYCANHYLRIRRRPILSPSQLKARLVRSRLRWGFKKEVQNASLNMRQVDDQFSFGKNMNENSQSTDLTGNPMTSTPDLLSSQEEALKADGKAQPTATTVQAFNKYNKNSYSRHRQDTDSNIKNSE